MMTPSTLVTAAPSPTTLRTIRSRNKIASPTTSIAAGPEAPPHLSARPVWIRVAFCSTLLRIAWSLTPTAKLPTNSSRDRLQGSSRAKPPLSMATDRYRLTSRGSPAAVIQTACLPLTLPLGLLTSPRERRRRDRHGGRLENVSFLIINSNKHWVPVEEVGCHPPRLVRLSHASNRHPHRRLLPHHILRPMKHPHRRLSQHLLQPCRPVQC